MVPAKEYRETLDVQLNEVDRANAQKALELEISNTQFYLCAASRTGTEEGRQLFRALGSVEAEHAIMWRRILRIPGEAIPAGGECSPNDTDNLKESHDREDKAIRFYAQAARESQGQGVKVIFQALVAVETDHLGLSEERLGGSNKGGKTMTKVNEVYKCELCGNVVQVLEAGGGELVCCGKPMKLAGGEPAEQPAQEPGQPAIGQPAPEQEPAQEPVQEPGQPATEGPAAGQ
jgi:desulfoferrodoxin-like iron-binding protein